MNNAPLTRTHMTPFYLNYGFHPCYDADVFSHHANLNNLAEDPKEFICQIHCD